MTVDLQALINIPHQPCRNQYRIEDAKRVCNSDVAAYAPIEVAAILQLPYHNIENVVTHIPELNKNFRVIQSAVLCVSPASNTVSDPGHETHRGRVQ